MTMTEWATPQTEAIATWLYRSDVRPQLERLVNAWNDLNLLGIDLADQLEALVSEHMIALRHDILPLTAVDWNQLAERVAEDLVGVDEVELTRRRLQAGGSD